MFWCRALAGACVASLALSAFAEEQHDAKYYFDRATGAFALNHFADAATNYEHAFELKPDPALLYDAAQAHRLAGNKPRALELYQSYVRIYGRKVPNRAEVIGHIAELQQAIEQDKRVASAPPTSTAPPQNIESSPPSTSSAPPPTTAPAAATTTAPAILTATTTKEPPKKPLIKRPWFWAVVGGGAAVVALGVGLGVGLGQSPSDPSPTFGRANGN